ncbi:uncharacterized protein KY384_002983 [Bacidia gigantensis]|uniref:uncharacterized protein n=1 Tax=Bacidia gigantensis TaxID=2732470 RepID=UPI001D0383AD|nr:uncharacterized protein KY384_002983 [Bacidia gigantensis]KAG8531354.1 hypothetical protein KY384_002983 [Bacidia gigantensis]
MPDHKKTKGSLTATNLSHVPHDPKHQVNTWKKDTQRQETIAVGKKTETKPGLTSDNLSRLQGEKPIDKWAKQPQSQERFALGEKTRKSLGSKGDWLGKIGESVDGRR